jgi:hypothetical protein
MARALSWVTKKDADDPYASRSVHDRRDRLFRAGNTKNGIGMTNCPNRIDSKARSYSVATLASSSSVAKRVSDETCVIWGIVTCFDRRGAYSCARAFLLDLAAVVALA